MKFTVLSTWLVFLLFMQSCCVNETCNAEEIQVGFTYGINGFDVLFGNFPVQNPLVIQVTDLQGEVIKESIVSHQEQVISFFTKDGEVNLVNVDGFRKDTLIYGIKVGGKEGCCDVFIANEISFNGKILCDDNCAFRTMLPW